MAKSQLTKPSRYYLPALVNWPGGAPREREAGLYVEGDCSICQSRSIEASTGPASLRRHSAALWLLSQAPASYSKPL
jgi:hypothetical protein